MAIGIVDIVAGKMVAQLGWVPADWLRDELANLDRAKAQEDMIAHLGTRGALDAKQQAKLRRYVDLYERVRREALYCALVERAGFLSKDELADWKKRLEKEGYATSLGEHLLAAKKIDPIKAGQLRQQQFIGIDRENDKLLEGYRKSRFEGVGRPITKNPKAKIETGVFTIKELFRSAESQRLARQALLVTQSDAGESTPGLRSALRGVRGAEPLEGGAGDLPRGGPRPPGAPERVGGYAVEGLLGRGGMGIVLLARHEKGGEPVALKLAHTRGASSGGAEPPRAGDEVRARMRREILATSMLHHENVVQVLDAGETPEGSPYLVMELVKGRELREILKERGFLPPREALAVFSQVAAAAGAAHAAGIVHRDLKPENILVVEEKGRLVAKLMDFGLARILEVDPAHEDKVFKTQATDVISGSPHYLSPEQVLGEDAGPRADLYALGVVLFELLTGALPWAATTMNEVLRAHVSRPPRRLAEARQGSAFPEPLESLVRSLLEKDPQKRPASANDVLTILERSVLPALQ